MSRLIALAFFFMFAVAGKAPAAVFSPESFTLSNGMQVVVVTNRRAPVVFHMVWYRVGAADEPAGKSGIAHFLEHLMFKGTKEVPPGEFSKIVARNGGTDNAFTSQDYTAYFQKVARAKLPLVMKMEADRMTNLVLTDKEVLPERDVVLEERGSRTDNNPAAQLYEAAQAALYLNHPYRIPVIGWRHEIEQLSTRDALDFYRRFYVPNNAVLIVSGDVSARELKPLAEKYYGKIPKGHAVERKRLAEPQSNAARRVSLESPRVGQARFSRTYTAPSYRTATGNEAYALQVLADILGGGARSRLHRALVIEQKIAAGAGAWYDPSAYDLGDFSLSATPRADISLEKIEAALDAELRLIAEKGVTAEEVRKSVKSLAASAIFARDSVGAAPNIIGRALMGGQTLKDIEAWPERITRVTPEEVTAAARKVFNLRNSVTSLLKPKRSGKAK